MNISLFVKRIKLKLSKAGILNWVKGYGNIFDLKKKQFRIGRYSRIGNNNYFQANDSGVISIGNECVICNNCNFISKQGCIVIGNKTQIGDNNFFSGQGGLEIGENVLTASNVALVANEHDYSDIYKSIICSNEIPKKILIGDECWIGINATVLGGTIIGKHCVIGAGSVVKGVFPDYSVIAGNPAKIIKQYDNETKKWIRV